MKTVVKVVPLNLSLKKTIRHAAATRNEGESIWVKVRRNDEAGYGEGCPRSYVAGDDLKESISWIKKQYSSGQLDIKDLSDLKRRVEIDKLTIDKFPSAWCAVELAFLDLFAKENNCTVETLLGLNNYNLTASYTAVMADDKKWTFTVLADKYLIRGLKDYKIKLSGKIERDREKIDILENLCQQHGISGIRIRIDANNFWHEQCDDAIEYIKDLGAARIYAIEEPVTPRDFRNLSKISLATGLPIILDESLCTMNDLELFKQAAGDFIANIKISRVGGIIRSLKMIEEAKKIGWPIIIGCHVGETSLLTRAALIAASAAGENLIAHEGAFGDYLIEREPVDPVLKFGRHGILDLSSPYYVKSGQGLKIIPPDNWNRGFGLQCRMPGSFDDGKPSIRKLEMPDKYQIHYRMWGENYGEDVLLILHGGMSHSRWQAPLAKSIRTKAPNMTVVAADRRGCGLNEKRGDLGSVDCVIDDVINHILFLKKSFNRIHLAGWCQGAQYASIVASRLPDAISSLILLTPGFFWNDRFRSVMTIAEKIVMDVIGEFSLKPERDHACIPIPMEATDFTYSEEWLDFIENDRLKTTMITLKSVNIMDEIQELSWYSMLQNKLPLLVIIADRDRIVDNNKVTQFIKPFFDSSELNKMTVLDSAHAIQFEKPSEVAAEILSFIESLGKREKSYDIRMPGIEKTPYRTNIV